MPQRGQSNAERASAALIKLEAHGGPDALPEVLKSADVIPLMGKGWFGDALRLDLMPGMRVAAGGVWRCEREAFVAWLRDMAGPVPASAPGCGDSDAHTR